MAALSAYQKKRDFSKTSEPKAKTKAKKKREIAPGGKLIFVVQRHKASRLHYDFRLEMEGTLKSWAVPKGPSLNPADKRLAMMVEDHPVEYARFKGVIPEGNYGAGIVEIWDSGTYESEDQLGGTADEKKLLKDLRKGSLKIILHGKKLKGKFALVKMKTSEDNAWLLIKEKDKYAVKTLYNSEDDTPANSPINQWLKKHDGDDGEDKPGAPPREAAKKKSAG